MAILGGALARELGNVVNALAIVAGAGLGLFLMRGIPQSYQKLVMQAIGLSTLLIGMQSALKSQDLLVVIIAMILGAVTGTFLRLEERLEGVGERLQGLVGAAAGRFTEAFMTPTLVYIVGAMAVMGPLQSGLTGDHSIVYAKSVLDGTTAIIFAATLGPGVVLSALPVFVYQGTITLFATWIAPFLTPPMLNELVATGGLLILGIGINLLELTRVKVGNLLPALIVAPLLVWLKMVLSVHGLP